MNLPAPNLPISDSSFDLRSLNAKPLPAEFFLQETAEVAKTLLGKGLYVAHSGGPLLAQIVEVEAYLGRADPASHAYGGLSKRNWPMFDIGGTCYVYLSYGVNYCMNVVTEEKGRGEAVLLRAAAPICGISQMGKLRGIKKGELMRPAGLKKLLSGPGKMTQALGIGLNYNGVKFNRGDFKLVDLQCPLSKNEIGASPRIGISKAKNRRLRFFIKSSPWLSRKLH